MQKIGKYLIIDFIKSYFNFFIVFTLFVIFLSVIKYLIVDSDNWLLSISSINYLQLILTPLIISIIIFASKFYSILKKDKENEFFNVGKHITIMGNENEIFQELKEYCLSRKWYVFRYNKQSMVLKCFTNSNFWSIGEVVKIQLHKQNDKSFIVEILSKHIFPFQLVDLGRYNLKNLHSIEDRLQKYKLVV